MTHILIVNPIELNKKVAEELKNQKLVQPTPWSKFVKTGHHKDRLPDNPDWWYARSAAVLRSVAKLGPVGTEKLRTKFGGRKRRGYLPGHFYKASGSILRKILQQLEKSGLIQQAQKGVHKGRILTPKGTSFLDKIAVQMSKQEHKDSQ
ncbi:MAG TPA: 30S ribosomal protein S19e [Candidatus Nanoarchaeia archaeon]|nr:30S ribosomal protein S19e [Candidatus Nanoarchaeia archaeon]